jgi:hypothetical protein
MNNFLIYNNFNHRYMMYIHSMIFFEKDDLKLLS